MLNIVERWAITTALTTSGVIIVSELILLIIILWCNRKRG